MALICSVDTGLLPGHINRMCGRFPCSPLMKTTIRDTFTQPMPIVNKYLPTEPPRFSYVNWERANRSNVIIPQHDCVSN